MTIRDCVAAILLLFSSAIDARAGDRTVVFAATSADPDHGLAGAAIRLQSAIDDGASRTIPLDDSGNATTMLPIGSHWIASSATTRYWMAAESLNVGADAAPLQAQYRIWPTGALKGAVRFAGEHPKKTQSLSVTGEKIPGRNSEVPAFEVECPLDTRGNWKCTLPAAVLDLSFRAADSAAAYRWDVLVPRGTTRDIGALTLRAGASVTGWARTEDRKTMALSAQVTLTRVVAGAATARLAERLARPVARASVAPNGFFQLTGVDSGAYQLNVTQRGYAAASLYPIEVLAGAESRIKQIVTVRRPLTLRVAVVPPRDWAGELWTVSISRLRDFSMSPEGPPLFEGKTDDAGTIHVPQQSPGTFRATVYDSKSNPFRTASFTASTELDPPHLLEIGSIQVNGHLKRSGQPVSAALSFGGRHGATRVDTRSDSDGHFSAVLPRGGQWRVEVDGDEGSTTFLETDVDAYAHGAADVELVLPSNRIDGIVLDENDQPVGGASVAYVLKGMVTARTNSDGMFVFRDVPVGHGHLSAQASRAGRARQTEDFAVDVAEGANVGPIELRLRRSKHVSGEVRSPRGIVAGAMVSMMSTDRSQPFYTRSTTNADGIFDFDAPDALPDAVFIVSPPGFALRAFTAPLDGRELVLNVPTSGGTLRVRADTADSAARLAVSIEQDGKLLPVPDLSHWVGAAAAASSGNAWDIPNVSAGHYRVCLMRMTSDSAPPYACSEGDLAPAGQLELAPKLP